MLLETGTELCNKMRSLCLGFDATLLYLYLVKPSYLGPLCCSLETGVARVVILIVLFWFCPRLFYSPKPLNKGTLTVGLWHCRWAVRCVRPAASLSTVWILWKKLCLVSARTVLFLSREDCFSLFWSWCVNVVYIYLSYLLFLIMFFC